MSGFKNPSMWNSAKGKDADFHSHGGLLPAGSQQSSYTAPTSQTHHKFHTTISPSAQLCCLSASSTTTEPAAPAALSRMAPLMDKQVCTSGQEGRSGSGEHAVPHISQEEKEICQQQEILKQESEEHLQKRDSESCLRTSNGQSTRGLQVWGEGFYSVMTSLEIKI